MLYETVKDEQILFLKNILIDKLPIEFKVEHSLSFEESSITTLPLKLIVGGNLYLTNSAVEIFSLNQIIVCGDLYLDSKIQIPNINLIYVGGEIKGASLEQLNLINSVPGEDYPMLKEDFIYVEGRLTPIDKVLSFEKNTITFYKNIFKNKQSIIKYKWDDQNIEYFPCNNLRDGYEKIYQFKIKLRAKEANIDLSTYTINSLVSIDEAATLFRICTGACQEGIDEFIENLENKKDYYTIKEVIDLTKGVYHYSYLFADFFNATDS